MTWKMTLRGDSTAPISAEYECPVHGRFMLTVMRPAPDEVRCPVAVVDVDRDGVTVLRGESEVYYQTCEQLSPWRFPTPPGRVRGVEMVRGKTGELPPDHVMMDTRPLADGMDPAEFRANRAKVHRDESLRRVRALRSR